MLSEQACGIYAVSEEACGIYAVSEEACGIYAVSEEACMQPLPMGSCWYYSLTLIYLLLALLVLSLLSTESELEPGPRTDLQVVEKAQQEAANRGGTTTIRFLHVAILGAARVGKTSLLNALMDKDHNEDELSTPGMRTSYATTEVSRERRFVECDDISQAMNQLYITTMLRTFPVVADRNKEDERQVETSAAKANTDVPEAAEVVDEKDGAPDVSQPKPVEQPSDKQLFRNAIHETVADFLKRNMGFIHEQANRPDYTVVTFRDLGGQQVYQSVQPLFMSKNTTFIAAYNSSHPLLERLPKMEETRVGKKEYVERTTLPSDATRLDQLLSWLDMLLLHAKADTEESTTDDVLMVGCQSDEWLKTNLKDPRKLLQQKIKNSPYESLVWNDESHFIIDSTRFTAGEGTHPAELQRLRDTIIDRCAESERAIPLPWLRFCIAIHMLKKAVPMPWVSYEEAMFVAKSIDAIDLNGDVEWQMKRLLQYCHEAGHLAYFPTFTLEGTVILDPQFVLDCVSGLVYPVFDKSIQPVDRRRCREGFMTDSQARVVLDQKFRQEPESRSSMMWCAVKCSRDEFRLIFEILEELSVLAIVDRSSSATSAKSEFIVPAIIKDYPKQARDLECTSQCAYVCLQRTGDVAVQDKFMHFPVFLYWQCVVEALLRSPNRAASTLSLCSVRLYWNRNDWPWLHICYTRSGLQLYLEGKPRSANDTSGKTTLDAVKEIVTAVLDKWKLVAQPVSSLPCPCGKQLPDSNCLPHGLPNCTIPSCAHALLNVVDGEFPMCPLDRTMVEIRDQAMFWLGLDQVSD